MPANSGHLGAKQEAAALLLAGGYTHAEVAALCDCGERSVRRWLRLPAFVARVAALQSQLFGEAVGRLARVAGKAAQTLERLLDSANDNAALGAAKAVLEVGPRLKEAVVLAQELAELKAAVEKQNQSQGAKP
jgi:transposase-like protein